MNMDKEKFRGLCLEVLPLINGITEAVKRNGYETMASLTTDGNDYFSFRIHDTAWEMDKVNGGAVKMHYKYSEEIQLQDQQQDKIVYNKASENLVEISLVYVNMLEEHKKMSSIDSATWKQLFVQWANDFETVNVGVDWDQKYYLEEIEKFARQKILEYIGLEV